MDVITTHINADFDCLAGMVAAKLLYPDALLVFAGAQEPALRKFLQTDVGAQLEITRSKNIDFSAITRLILVDVNTPERIGPFANLYNNPDVELHIYDHHPLIEHERQPTVINVAAVGSTVTLMVPILQDQQLQPNADQATMMMLGLYEDTDNLTISIVCEADYLAAAYLLKCGADMVQVANSLTREMSVKQIELLHQLLQSLQLVSVHGVDVYLAQACIDSYVGDIAVLAHKIRDMENIDALILVVRLEDRVFLVGRSRIAAVDVGQLLTQFGGGGHASAASATVHDKTVVQIMAMLPMLLEQLIVPQCFAEHLMSSPVHVVGASQTIQLARVMLTRYHINALIVVDDSGEDGQSVDLSINSRALVPVGVISRQVIERAVYHGLAEQPVSEYMNVEFGVAAPDSPLAHIQQLVIDQHHRLVPIIDCGKLVGVVTRTDLLRYSMTEGHRLYKGIPKKGGAKGGGDGLSLNKRHVARLIDLRLPPALHQLLKDVAAVADNLGLAVYAVGGFVRDLLLDKKNLDVDIVVEGNAIDFARSFARQFTNCRVREHEKFITAVIIFDDGFKLDVASTRTEYYLEPGALPLVEEASIKLDLYRRDFTINTLALSLNDASFGELLDFFGAQRDLHDKAIRVLHNLSFVEDPTRAFRAVRFEQRLGFKLGLLTERLLRSAIKGGFLERVNPARLFNELLIILHEDVPFMAVQRLDELDLLQFLCTNFKIDPSMQEKFVQAGKAISWYELLYTGEAVESELVYFLCLSTVLQPQQLEHLCQRLKLPQRLINLFIVERERYLVAYNTLERYHKKLDELPPHRVYDLLHGTSVEMLLYFMAITPHESVRLAISRYVTQLQEVAPLLNGDDLIRLGAARGPNIGTILHQLLDARLDGLVVTKADEEQFVVQRLG